MLRNLAQNHEEDGSRSSHDVERDSTLASTVAMLESRLSALDERMDAVEPCRCRCKGNDSLSTEGILGDLSGTPEEEDVTDDGVVVADPCQVISLYVAQGGKPGFRPLSG